MKKIILFTLLSFGSLFAQNPINFHYCNYVYGANNHALELCRDMQSRSFVTNTEAEKAVDKLLEPIGLRRNFILVSCPNIQNCAAVTYGDGYRYIVYDNNFMQSIQNSAQNNWTSISILAHELGHHLNGHTLSRSTYEEQRQEELEADEFSGFILRKLGASLNDAQAAMRSLPHPTEQQEQYSDHPCLAKRLNSISVGWNKANGISNDQPNRQEDVSREETKPLERSDDPIEYLDYYRESLKSWKSGYNASSYDYSFYIQNNSKYKMRILVKLPYGFYEDCIDSEETFVRQGFERKLVILDAYESTSVIFNLEVSGTRCTGISDAVIGSIEYLEN